MLLKGQTFTSFTEFEQKFKRFQNTNHMLFTTLKSALCNDISLKYLYIKYGCKHFGNKRVNQKLTGERPVQKYVYNSVIECYSGAVNLVSCTAAYEIFVSELTRLAAKPSYIWLNQRGS